MPWKAKTHVDYLSTPQRHALSRSGKGPAFGIHGTAYNLLGTL